jgi:hypothetical protein
MGRPTHAFYPAQPVAVFASAARDNTGAESGIYVSDTYEINASQYRGVLILANVTVDGAASTGFVVDVDDKLEDGEWTTRLASATINGTGTTLMLLHPSAPTDRANQIEKTPLNYKWRVTWTHSDENAMTGSVQAYYLI